MGERIDTVVFDLDGVLILGSNEGYVDCHSHALRSVGISMPRAELRGRLFSFWSQPHQYQLTQLIGDPARAAVACLHYEEYLFSDRFFARVSLLRGARPLLRKLHDRGFTLAVATGMHPRQLDSAFRTFGIRRSLFSVIVSGYELEDSAQQKPNPYMLQLILRTLQRAPAAAVYVGDSADDLIMARRAGVFGIAVLTGNLTRSRVRHLEPDGVLANATQLPAFLGRFSAVAQRDGEERIAPGGPDVGRREAPGLNRVSGPR